MAISVVDQRLIITCGYASGFEEAHNRICTLLRLLMAADPERIDGDVIYTACEMIEDLLPAVDQVKPNR